MDVSENSGFSPKSSILIGCSIIFTIHFGVPPFLETPKSRGFFFLIFHHPTVFGKPIETQISLCISSKSMAGVPTYKAQTFEVRKKKKQGRQESEKMGGTKFKLTFFCCVFGHLTVLYISKKNTCRSKFPCVWCVSEKYVRFMLHLWRLSWNIIVEVWKIILPFFSWLICRFQSWIF